MGIFYYDAQAIGANNGTTKADAFQTMLAAIAGTGLGDTVYASHTSNEIVASPVYALAGQIFISVDFAGSTPPSNGDYLAGAIVDARPSLDISFTGNTMHSYGIDYAVGDDFRPLAFDLNLYDCTVTISGGLDKFDLLTSAYVTLHDVTIVFGNAGAIIDHSGGDLTWRGGVLSGAATNLFAAFGSAKGNHIIEDVDLSGADNLIAVTGLQASRAIFKGCILKSGFTLYTGILGGSSHIALYGSHSSNIPYFIQEEHAQGGLITEATNVKTGGSSDGTTPISMKFVTNADAVRYTNPLRMALPILFYASTTGVQTFDVDIMTDGLTLQDDEAFLSASVPGTTIQRDISDSKPATPLTTPANLPLSAATWDETGIAAAVKQTISITVDVKQVGWVEAHICFARPSETMYADLKVLDGQRQFLAGQAYINGEAGATCDYAGASDLRLGVTQDNGNITGTAAIPSADDTRDGVPVDATVGNMTLPTEPQVAKDINYGANGTEFTGELETTIKGPIKLIKLDTGIKVIKL